MTDAIKTIYVVHSGTIVDKTTGNTRLNRPVCSRLTLADAQSVASELNAAQEGALFMTWAASKCFPLLKGDGAELQAALADADVMAEWERYFSPLRREIYTVRTVEIATEEEQRQLAAELLAESEALSKATY
jgi:hypothetical protein